MKKLIERFGDKVKGMISGFDRIVFKGYILPVMVARGAMDFCSANHILNKDYKTWMMTQTELMVDAVDRYAKEQCGQGIIPIPSWRTRKEELARKRQETEKMDSGLIGAWSCQELGSSFKSTFCRKSGRPQLKNYKTRCKHLYLYFDHPDYGFMNIRIQTWFPYPVQICLNGREWLRRCLEKNRIEFLSQKNKFFHIADCEIAQKYLDMQLDTRFAEMLNGFMPVAFPTFRQTMGPYLSWYWTMWQSEWATDLILTSPDEMKTTFNSILRHAHMTGTSSRVLRYLDRPVTLSGKPRKNFKEDVITRVLDFNDGIRVRHWVGNNSVKVYNEQNVLRIETTINDPETFKVFRHKQGQNKSEPKARRPIRRGVMDIPFRADASKHVNSRVMDSLSSYQDESPAQELMDLITHRQTFNGKRFRGLDPIGKDREILQIIGSPEFLVNGLTNKMLRQKLTGSPLTKGLTQKQLSAKISRYLCLLRAHGLIRKLPNQNRYLPTVKGVKTSNTLSAFLASSTEKLMGIAA